MPVRMAGARFRKVPAGAGLGVGCRCRFRRLPKSIREVDDAYARKFVLQVRRFGNWQLWYRKRETQRLNSEIGPKAMLVDGFNILFGSVWSIK